jgi:hypothetical protein
MLVRVAVGVFVALVGAAYLLFAVVHGKVTPARLANSVAGEAGHLSMEPCNERGDDGRWSCGVWIDQGEFSSGGVDYDVRVKAGSSCWTASLDARTAAKAGVPPRLDGCVRVLQLLGLSDD